jgi:hypothetical protein
MQLTGAAHRLLMTRGLIIPIYMADGFPQRPCALKSSSIYCWPQDDDGLPTLDGELRVESESRRAEFSLSEGSLNALCHPQRD